MELHLLRMALAIGGKRQIGVDRVGNVNLSAEFAGHQSSLAVQRAHSRFDRWRVGVGVADDRGAKAQLSDPRAQNEGDEQTVLHRCLTADAGRSTGIVIGANRAEDREGEIMGFAICPLTPAFALALALSRKWARGKIFLQWQLGDASQLRAK